MSSLPGQRDLEVGAQTREAVHRAARVVRLDETVGVQQDVVAGPDVGLALLVAMPGISPSGMPVALNSTTPVAVRTYGRL